MASIANSFSNMLGGGNTDAKQMGNHKQAVQSLFQAYNSRNLSAALGTGVQGENTAFAPNVVAHGVRMNGADITGLDDLRTHEQAVLNAFGEMTLTPHIIEAAGPYVFALVTFQGKQTGALPSGFPASGRSTTGKAQSTFRFDSSGKIAEWWMNCDHYKMAQDIGMAPPCTTCGSSGSSTGSTGWAGNKTTGMAGQQQQQPLGTQAGYTSSGTAGQQGTQAGQQGTQAGYAQLQQQTGYGLPSGTTQASTTQGGYTQGSSGSMPMGQQQVPRGSGF